VSALQVERQSAWAQCNCPWWLRFMTPEQLFNWRMARFADRDLDGIMCTYAPDAAMIIGGSVLRGHDEIRANLQMVLDLFPTTPTVTSVTANRDVVMATFTAEGPIFAIPDGADTFVFRFGLIHTHTVHASLVPVAP